MRIMCIGDIVGKPGRNLIVELLEDIRREEAVDVIIANGENAAGGSGITPRIANHLFRCGCHVLTLGDHTWDREEVKAYLEEHPQIIRPANFPPGAPGRGWTVIKTVAGAKIGVINLLGRVFMRYNVDCPFRMARSIIADIKKETNIIVLDFHAETTSEKIAMGHFLDGEVTAIVGTHTHIQTADEKVLPKGTAYITDLGMSGPYDSVIGQHKEKIIRRFVTGLPHRFEVAKGDPVLHGVIVDVDATSGRSTGISRIQRPLPANADDQDASVAQTV